MRIKLKSLICRKGVTLQRNWSNWLADFHCSSKGKLLLPRRVFLVPKTPSVQNPWQSHHADRPGGHGNLWESPCSCVCDQFLREADAASPPTNAPTPTICNIAAVVKRPCGTLPIVGERIDKSAAVNGTFLLFQVLLHPVLSVWLIVNVHVKSCAEMCSRNRKNLFFIDAPKPFVFV